MKSAISFMLIFFVFCALCFETAEANKAQIMENYGKIPLAFTMNQGQVDSQVKFTSRGSGCSMFFTPQGTTFLLSKETETSVAKRLAKRSVVYQNDPHGDRESEVEKEYFALKLNFLNANTSPEIVGEGRLPWNNNYFIGNDPSKWRTDVPNYEKIRLKNIYDGVDLVYYGNNNKIEYDFVVKAGHNLSNILLKYDFGTDTQGSLSVNTSDQMVVSTPLGDLLEHKPYCYQVINGKKVEVDGQYKILDASEHTFSFAVEEYNSAYDLVIDPTLEYSTYLGGSDDEGCNDIVVDDLGSVYVAGSTGSNNFQVYNPYQSNFEGVYDSFVTKFSPSGITLEYSTYLGGSNNDGAIGLSIDGSGNVYVVGVTESTDFPILNSYQSYKNDGEDVFVTKLNASGNDLVYSTYLGGNDRDFGSRIAVDTSGNSYVTGQTSSTDFPVVNPYQSNFGGGEWGDGFVAKLNVLGNDLVYSTYLGGISDDNSNDIVVDVEGSAYVVGTTRSTDFPVVNPYQMFQGNSDAFVTKFTPSGNELVFSTCLGGDGLRVV